MQIDSLFADAPLPTRFFLWLRSILTPYGSIASALPAQGRVLDLGCGHGLLALELVLGSSQREVIGIDHDSERIRLARLAARRLAHTTVPTFEIGDLMESLASFASGSLAGIAMIDILHYFDPATQRLLVSEAARVLSASGILVIREIDSDAGIKAAANRLYERLATGVGFTQSVGRTLSFQGARGWASLLESAGFTVRFEPCGPPFLADVLFVARRRP